MSRNWNWNPVLQKTRERVRTGDPKCCPRCGGTDVVDMDIQWAAVSENVMDPGNASTLNEWQCRTCINRSFWVA